MAQGPSLGMRIGWCGDVFDNQTSVYIPKRAAIFSDCQILRLRKWEDSILGDVNPSGHVVHDHGARISPRYMSIYIYRYRLVVLTILKNMTSSLGMMTFPTEWKNKKCLKPPTSIYVWVINHFLASTAKQGPEELWHRNHNWNGMRSGGMLWIFFFLQLEVGIQPVK